MATRPNINQARRFAQLIAELQPEIQRAFMASVTDLQAHVDWNRLIRELERGNIDGAIAALNINSSAWVEYSSAMTNVYAAAGASTAAQIMESGLASIGVRFNLENPRAKEWIEKNVASMIVGFANDQIESARELIAAGYAKGHHPHTIALDLVGRSTGGGRREGGILGLDSQRAHRYNQVTSMIRTPEGVRDLVVQHQDGTISLRYKVNKATENKILSAWKAGTAVPDDQAAIIRKQYFNALLKDRADTIAETETGNAVMAARSEEWAQFAGSKGISTDAVIKTWWHRRGATKYHRPDHLAMSGTSVNGLHTPFVFPDGTLMQHAHDPEAGPEHTIRCGCDTEYRINRNAIRRAA